MVVFPFFFFLRIKASHLLFYSSPRMHQKRTSEIILRKHTRVSPHKGRISLFLENVSLMNSSELVHEFDDDTPLVHDTLSAFSLLDF